jgi:hypothetical protein
VPHLEELHVHPDAPALEAVAGGLGQLLERIVALADRHRDDPDDPWTRDLDELERTLRTATRRLDRMLT